MLKDKGRRRKTANRIESNRIESNRIDRIVKMGNCADFWEKYVANFYLNKIMNDTVQDNRIVYLGVGIEYDAYRILLANVMK
jgi:hypothetical protein